MLISQLERIREELKAVTDEKTRRSFQRFFKEVACYGVKAGVVRKIAKKYWREVRAFEKGKIFSLCEECCAPTIMKMHLWFVIGC